MISQIWTVWNTNYRFDFVLDANHELRPVESQTNPKPKAKHSDDYENYNDEDYTFDPTVNLDGTKYKHSLGVFPIRFEGLLMCEGVFVSSDALLVYHKPNTNRRKAEIELTSLYQESRESVSWKVFFYQSI